jgi:peptide/nickel transport system ATP-binding protein
MTKNTGEIVLEVERLGIGLRLDAGEVPVIADMNFRVATGQTLGIVGESGSGKSLTALSIMRMLPPAATINAGTIRFQGQDLLSLPESQIRTLRGDRLGMVFQDPQAFLNPLMTIGQQIREVLILHGTPKVQAARRAIELLDHVGVHEPHKRVNDYPHQFSGGMRQRVLIAMAVANQPALLIADEPTSALDVTVQAEILSLLAGLRDELGMAMVMITHDIGVVEQICDSVLVMYAGSALEHGDLEDVLRNPGNPYTRDLLRSTPRLDLPATRRLPTIPGKPPDVADRPSGCPFHPRCSLAMEICVTEHPPLIDRAGHARQRVACWASSSEPLPPVPVTLASRETDRRPSDTSVIAEVMDAHIGYRQKTRLFRGAEIRSVVHGVSLQARAGRALGIVGESGSGKTSLARAIMGIVPVTSGTISIGGREWTNLPRKERTELRRTVQLVFQDPYASLNPRHPVHQTLSEPLIVHRLAMGPELTARIEELIALVGLPASVLNRYPYQLSGGQRQRVCIARALAMEPKLIVADEPVSALDVSVQAQIINLLADLRDELGLGYIVISHDLSVVRHLCDEVAVMKEGRIVEHGETAEIFTDPQHPYTIRLLASSPGSPWATGKFPVSEPM